MASITLTADDALRVKQFVAKFRAFLNVPGISLSISAGDAGRVDACSGQENLSSKTPLSPDSCFEAGCMTKLMTALATLQLAADDKLDLDVPISEFLADLDEKKTRYITIRHLLSHTAGYQEMSDSLDAHTIPRYSWSDFRTAFAQGSMLFEPGTVYDYSHTASVIVGRIIERVTGCGSLLHAKKRILEPLDERFIGSNASTEWKYVAGHLFNVSSQRYSVAPSIAWSEFWTDSLLAPPVRMSDLVALGEAVLGKNDLIEPAVSRLLMNPVVDLPVLHGGKQREDVAVAFGLGLAQYAPGVYGLSSLSATQTCALRIDVNNRIVIAVGINACQPYSRDFLVNKILGALMPEGSPVRDVAEASETFTIDQLVGHYEGRMKNSFDLSAIGESLSVRVTENSTIPHSADQKPIVLIRSADGCFVPRDDMRFLSMGFFRSTSAGVPCFMIGGNVYRRMTSS